MFIIFFSIGTAALAISILCADLLRYYQNKQLLQGQKELSDKLKSLNDDYDQLLRQLREDPNLVKRIARITLGGEPNEANTIYPKVKMEHLLAARKALSKEVNRNHGEPKAPKWLTRCSEPYRRIMLFFCGSGLIVISFICFGPARQVVQNDLNRHNKC